MATYDALVAAAKAKRDKAKSPRWKEMDKRTVVSNFLNSGKKHEVVAVTGKTPAYIVTQLNMIIMADDVSELCYAVETEGNAELVSFISEKADENDPS
jgi:hypothetical protein